MTTTPGSAAGPLIHHEPAHAPEVTTMNTTPNPDIPIDRLLASVRSVVATVPAPRPPADEREPDGWQPAGRYEIRLEPVTR